MELTSTQIFLVNSLLPARYKVEMQAKIESRPVTFTQRRSEAENLDFNVRFQPRLPEKRPQRELSSSFEETFDQVPKQSEGSKKLFKIISDLKTNPKIQYFQKLIDKRSNPDYYEKISKPMDLSTVESKLHNGDYESGYQFALDMRLIWSNSFFYNSNNSELYSATMELSSYFERLMKGNEDLLLSEQKNLVQSSQKKIDASSKNTKITQVKQPISQPEPKPLIKPIIDKPLGFLEKKELCQNIKKLEPKYLKGVLDIVKECMDIKGEELEFDIEKLPPKVCRELEKYVKNCLQLINRSQKSKKPGNIEEIKTAQQVTSAKISEINSRIESLNDNSKSEVYLPAESESESSSTSESEEEEEMPSTQRVENTQDFNPYSSMIDFDKLY